MLRRRTTSHAAGSQPALYTNTRDDTPDRDDDREASSWRVSARSAFVLLLAARVVSAMYNIVHDCDEVFNYWEPLHYLLYGSGMQTWEYSAEFALRSYVYLLLHTLVAGPAALLFGAAAGKRMVWYATRMALGVASAATEADLYGAVLQRCGAPTAHPLLLLLITSAGMFCASTSMLPSSFSMFCMTAAAAGVLQGRYAKVIVSSAVGIVLGWVVAGAAFLPYALWVLASAPLLPALGWALAAAAGTLGPIVITDRMYYGRWTVSLWNFVEYNVVGGGDSALYGVETPSYYVRNGINNLNLAMVLALAAPAAVVLHRLAVGSWPCCGGSNKAGGGGGGGGGGSAGGGGGFGRLVVAVLPVYLWLAAITSLPHKEERFLYVTYPLICLAAAVVIASLPTLASALGRSVLGLPRGPCAATGRLAAAAALLGFVALSVMRSAAMVLHYGAPLQVYTHLPELPDWRPGQPTTAVCTGAEWHRYPSSFFLPGPGYRLRFVRSGFGGLLPHQYDASLGGTSASPPWFNNRNAEEAANRWEDASQCKWMVAMRPEETEPVFDEREWQPVAGGRFVDAARSRALYRALYIPGLSPQHVRYSDYTLYRRREHMEFEMVEVGRDQQRDEARQS